MINNYKEVKSALECISMLKEMIAEFPENIEAIKASNDAIVGIKRNVREFYKRTLEPSRYTIVKDEGIDGAIVKMTCPDSVKTREDAEEWFMENEYIGRRHSAYDCTGESFTWTWWVFNLNNKWVVYHSIAIDC